MKIPEEQCVNYKKFEALKTRWDKAAEDLSLEYGIYVTVGSEIETRQYGSSPFDVDFITKRIYFKVMDHEFESLRDLRKALDNKAFM